MDPFHDAAVAETVFNFCVVDGPELFFTFELDFAPADRLFLGN